MPSVLPRILHILAHLIPAQRYEVGTIIILILQMNSVRHRAIKHH